jgi:hypothetical protein
MVRIQILAKIAQTVSPASASKTNNTCILNRQYTKEEYEELVPKIIKHMNVSALHR